MAEKQSVLSAPREPESNTNDEISTKKSVGFDEEDAEYLSSNLTRDQLRKEIHNAEVRRGVSMCWAEDAEVIYWREFGKVCREALEVQRSRQPKVEARFGELSVRAVREAHNIVDIVGQYTELRKAGTEYTGKCPFHDERQPSFEVNKDKQLFYCFSCQRKGDLVNFIMQIEGLDTKEACLFLNRGLQ